LTDSPGYNAEATITRDGTRIVFTSTRNGDLDIYTMNADGSGVRQLTHELGYDGGPFWSYDGKKIVYRAEHPKTPEEIADYKSLLAQNLIRPGNLELWVMDADGGHKHQVTHNGAANFGPYWFPDGKRIIFASNMADAKNGRDFDLYVINEDGTGLERVTYHPDFDGFPMFSSDGKRLVWASNRNGTAPHETNIFIADWVESGVVQATSPAMTQASGGLAGPVRIRVGGNVQAAKIVNRVQPMYPNDAREAGITGTVRLHVILAKDGTVESLELVSGHPLLAQAAIDAVRQWVYQPTVLNGERVEVDTTIDVIFSLNH